MRANHGTGIDVDILRLAHVTVVILTSLPSHALLVGSVLKAVAVLEQIPLRGRASVVVGILIGVAVQSVAVRHVGV